MGALGGVPVSEAALERQRALGEFLLASTPEDDESAVIARAAALLASVFLLDYVAIVIRSASGDVVRGEGIAPFALTPSQKQTLDRAKTAEVGSLGELSWAHFIVANGSGSRSSLDTDVTAAWVPLTGEREVRGFFIWQAKAPPDADDLPFLQLFAKHVVHALHNVRLTEALRAREGELAKANLLLRQSLADVERAQEHLASSSRHEAIGRLAGGVAHDFNNLLTVILANAELLREDLPADPALHETLLPILDSAERASQITRQLLMFSRKDVVATQDLSLNDVTADLLNMLRRLVGEQVNLKTSLDPRVGIVHADRSQLQQVILNLVTNARDAMPRGGTITLETRAATPAEVDRAGARLDPSCYVALSVEDAGEGMTAETLERIFDPFFTTKDLQRGTGLGLSIVQGAVQKAEGHVLVDSKLGSGSRFVLLFPETGARKRLHPEAQEPRTATVLLVEDEDAIRAVARRVLTRSGFRVLEASNGEEALAVARREGSVDLLLTDVVMPRLSGVELADTLRHESRARGVLFMSGYTFETLEVHKLGPNERFLQKPFTPRELLARVSECIASDTPAPPPITHGPVTH